MLSNGNAGLTFRFDGTEFAESNGLRYRDKPGGFVKCLGSVVVRSHKRGEPVFCH